MVDIRKYSTSGVPKTMLITKVDIKTTFVSYIKTMTSYMKTIKIIIFSYFSINMNGLYYLIVSSYFLYLH